MRQITELLQLNPKLSLFWAFYTGNAKNVMQILHLQTFN